MARQHGSFMMFACELSGTTLIIFLCCVDCVSLFGSSPGSLFQFAMRNHWRSSNTRALIRFWLKVLTTASPPMPSSVSARGENEAPWIAIWRVVHHFSCECTAHFPFYLDDGESLNGESFFPSFSSTKKALRSHFFAIHSMSCGENSSLFWGLQQSKKNSFASFSFWQKRLKPLTCKWWMKWRKSSQVLQYEFQAFQVW